MSDILPILVLVSAVGFGLLQMFNSSPAAYSNSSNSITGGRRRKTRKNFKK